MKKQFLSFLLIAMSFALPALADGELQNANAAVNAEVATDDDELDPFAPDIEEQLKELDAEFGEGFRFDSRILGDRPMALFGNSCYRSSCAVYIHVRKSDQRMDVYVNGNPHAEFLVSTGAPGHGTPDFDKHPNGRIYDKYSSRKFPGGDYMGLGNMPYAVFIEGGFAIHGTMRSNWKYLGQRASHGCVRLHPDNAFIVNRLVRQYGVDNTWIQVD